MASIILTGGGTAGHCIPALSLIPYLKNDFTTINYIGSEFGIERDIISKTNIPYHYIPCVKLDRSLNFKNLLIPIKLINSIKKAGKLLDKIKPDIIFSKGGYVSLPTVIAAKSRKIPVIAHESDYSVGLANKISARYCKKILTAFPDTAKNLKNGVHVGLPLKKSLFSPYDKSEILNNFGFSGKKPILLITGGSQGAKVINDNIRACLNKLLKTYDIIHVCGKGNINNEINFKGYFQTEFLSNIENAFKICSVCVSRAGANTVFELLALKVPCLLIPLENNASRGDQLENANYFQKLGMVNVLRQNVITENSLLNAINSTYNNRKNIISNINTNPVKDASRQISRIIADYLH